jgi:beta-lactamase class A
MRNSKVLTVGLVSALAGIVFSFFYFYYFYKTNAIEANSTITENTQSNFFQKSLKGYKYVRPILFLEKNLEAKYLEGLKTEVFGVIENFKQSGIIDNASIFLIDMNRSEWTGVNYDEGYAPGSLLKVPLMITLYKMNQIGILNLNEVIQIDKKSSAYDAPRQTFSTESVQMGSSYSIEDLIKYMIIYSDNNATVVLNQIAREDLFKQTFTDLNLAEPYLNDYRISARNYSRFLSSLYFGGYIGRKKSERALEYLSQVKFDDGMSKAINKSNAKILHKFGESAVKDGHELHESGLVYLNNTAYMLTVMTKGKDVTKLPNVISKISGVVYHEMNNITRNRASLN